MRQKATVTAVLPDGRAEVRVVRRSACSGDCHQCGGCAAQTQTLRLTARNAVSAAVGDAVYVESDSAVVLRAAALVYLLPPALFLAGYLAALPLGNWAAAVGVGGALLGLLPAFLYNRRIGAAPPEQVITGFVK